MSTTTSKTVKKTKTKKEKTRESPWTEQFRPRTTKQIVGNQDVVRDIDEQTSQLSVPNICISGIQGVGKTTISNIIAWRLAEGQVENILIINGSEQGTMDYLRKKIIPFCDKTSLDSGRKVVVIEEADNMSTKVQPALRKVMEKYTVNGNVVFVLNCNYLNKIIPPLLSRCAKFKFGRVADKDMIKLLKRVQKVKKLTIEEGAIEKILKEAKGIPRDLITLLQMVSLSGKRPITTDLVQKHSLDVIVEEIMKEILKKKNLKAALDLTIKNMNEGRIIDERSMIEEIFNRYSSNGIKNELFRGFIIKYCAEADANISGGSIPLIQLGGLYSNILILKIQSESGK